MYPNFSRRRINLDAGMKIDSLTRMAMDAGRTPCLPFLRAQVSAAAVEIFLYVYNRLWSIFTQIPMAKNVGKIVQNEVWLLGVRQRFDLKGGEGIGKQRQGIEATSPADRCFVQSIGFATETQESFGGKGIALLRRKHLQLVVMELKRLIRIGKG